eukprot:scaffold3930_cov116-Isochrysis_galbana.AAC.2
MPPPPASAPARRQRATNHQHVRCTYHYEQACSMVYLPMHMHARHAPCSPCYMLQATPIPIHRTNGVTEYSSTVARSTAKHSMPECTLHTTTVL